MNPIETAQRLRGVYPPDTFTPADEPGLLRGRTRNVKMSTVLTLAACAAMQQLPEDAGDDVASSVVLELTGAAGVHPSTRALRMAVRSARRLLGAGELRACPMCLMHTFPSLAREESVGHRCPVCAHSYSPGMPEWMLAYRHSMRMRVRYLYHHGVPHADDTPLVRAPRVSDLPPGTLRIDEQAGWATLPTCPMCAAPYDPPGVATIAGTPVGARPLLPRPSCSCWVGRSTADRLLLEWPQLPDALGEPDVLWNLSRATGPSWAGSRCASNEEIDDAFGANADLAHRVYAYGTIMGGSFHVLANEAARTRESDVVRLPWVMPGGYVTPVQHGIFDLFCDDADAAREEIRDMIAVMRAGIEQLVPLCSRYRDIDGWEDHA